MLLRLVLLVTIFYGRRLVARCGVCNDTAVEGVLAQYERDSPPPAAPAQPLVVQLTLAVRLATVSQSDTTLTVLADFTMRWTDSRLSWNASEWGCENAVVSAERVWAPDVEPAGGAAGGAAGSAAPQWARLASDGAVLWAARLRLAEPLALDLAEWPHDLQTVTLAFASRAHTVDEIDLTIKDDEPRLIPLLLGGGAWTVESVRSELLTVPEVEGGSAARRVAAWAVAARRRAAAHVAAARALAAAPALLLVAAALLPPAHRAPLAATAALIACFWVMSCVSRTGGSVRAPRRVVAACWVAGVAGGCAVCAAAVSRLARRTAPPPPALRAALSKLAPFCALMPLQRESTGWSGIRSEEGGGGGGGCAAWGAAAVVADRALLAVLLVALLAALGLAL